MSRQPTVTTLSHFTSGGLGEFLLPLSPGEFQNLVNARQVFGLRHRDEIAGLCYVKPDGKELDDVPRWEFGGVYLDPSLRGLGLGVALSAVAIAGVTDADRKPVMAYIHQDNHEPRGLVRRLGFVSTGRTVSLAPDEARGYLRRDAAGIAVADVLELSESGLARIADCLDRFGGRADVSVRLSAELMRPLRVDVAAELRQASRNPEGQTER